MIDWTWFLSKGYDVLWSALTIGFGYWLGTMSRRVEHAMSRPAELLLLLSELIGDDDPRTYQTDEEWREILGGKEDFDHIEITVYASHLAAALDQLRPGWRGGDTTAGQPSE